MSRMDDKTMNRRERRAMRLRRFVTAQEARLAARLARLDYKTAGESGALKPPTRGRTWHKGGRLNGHRPQSGHGWSRSGPAYVVAVENMTLPRPVIHYHWRRLVTSTE